MPTSTRGRDPAVEEEFLGALYKGGELLASGKIVEAREHLEKAHGLAPRNEKAQNLLGLAYFKLGLFDQASEVYERLVNENPTDATLRVNLGLVYLKTNNLERCVKEFETATDLEPTHKKAHNYLGLALAQQGSYVKAREHFELAGSEPMAEKMSRAIAAQSTPSGMHAPVARQAPMSVVIGGDPAPSAPRPAPVAPARPPPVEEETIEVMSDEELPSDVYVVPEEVNVAPEAAATLNSDWGAQLRRPDEDTAQEMRFADDEGPPEASLQNVPPPVEEMPVLDAEIEPMPVEEAAPPASSTPSWLTMEANEAGREQTAPTDSGGWVTESVSDVPLPPAEAEAAPAQEPLGATDSRWSEAPAQEAATEWVTQEAPPPEQAVAEDGSWAAAPPLEEMPPVVEDASWATAPVEAQAPVADDASWATAPVAEEPAPVADDASWANAPAAEEPAPVADDASWATAPAAEEPAPVADDASWASAPAAEAAPAADDASWSTAPVAEAPAEAPLPTTPDDESWATGAVQPLPEPQWATEQVTGIEPTPEAPVEEQWSAPQDQLSEAISAAAPQPALDLPSPAASAPINITVEEPQEAPAPLAAPAGYAPMTPQRLVDLGASGAWVQEPSAGPFHISTDGLAVTVAGEMMVRMLGLVAIAGSVQVTPENRRRRGRSSQEPFGTGAAQLQRVSGNGVLYLEPGRSKFHAVDLTDQNGVGIDDDGAYLREEMVFAFEEAIFFENGRITAEGQSLELAHLKGNGKVLLQLDGSLRAMPIPLGAPMVVPLHRVVGWFGRVTPRLMGFGGRGAVELTGEGYALLGTPAEGR
ncbi:MAG: tetratricopeptide repeat protein [Archangium sp.]|nr:tetratricopeptide repeat protein [Archangium sp.]